MNMGAVWEPSLSGSCWTGGHPGGTPRILRVKACETVLI